MKQNLVQRLVVVLVVVGGSLAFAELVDRVAAVVNNDIITQSELELRVRPEQKQRLRSEPDPKRRGELRDQYARQALDALIGEKLMEMQARDLGIDVSEAEVEGSVEEVRSNARKANNIDDAQFESLLAEEGFSMASYKSFMKRFLVKQKLLQLKVRGKVKVGEEELKAEYAKLSSDEAKDFEVHARHILVTLPVKPTPEQVAAAKVKADALTLEARKPGADFGALAKAKSEGPSAPEGGDLGFFKRGVMMAEFEKVAFTTPVGSVSDPVRTKFGWHVIKVEEHRAMPMKPFDEVKDELRQKLTISQLEKYTEQYVQELRAAAVVDVKL